MTNDYRASHDQQLWDDIKVNIIDHVSNVRFEEMNTPSIMFEGVAYSAKVKKDDSLVALLLGITKEIANSKHNIVFCYEFFQQDGKYVFRGNFA